VNSVKKKCIIVDLDGTLTNCEHRVHHVQKSPKDWDSFNAEMVGDTLNEWCAELISGMRKQGCVIILLTGRDDDYRSHTESWLKKHSIVYDELYMRKAQDHRSDHIIKSETFLEFIAPQYETLFVVEDRLSVVEMWRKLNVTCLQCDWGNF